jgi:mono/diheme cytochrome c family protein
LLVALAFGASAGGEFVREGARKPYTIREVLFSNAISPSEVARLRVEGCTTNDPFPLREAASLPNDQVRTGALTFRAQCSICHTMGGVNSLQHLMGAWTDDQMRMNVAQLQWTKGFMPPFAGTAEELEALVQYVRWYTAKQPSSWPESRDPRDYQKIRAWLEEAGPAPATSPRPAKLATNGGE